MHAMVHMYKSEKKVCSLFHLHIDSRDQPWVARPAQQVPLPTLTRFFLDKL